MPLPRAVLPNSFYMISRRCTQRMFLLRPDDETNNAFIYCLAVAAQRYGIEVLLPCAMSNHHHNTIFDRRGTYPEFIEHFHKLLARSQNVLRRRWENFWATEQTSVVRLTDREDVMRKLVYVATNPVKDHLVDRVHHWPGVNGLNALLSNRTLHAHRPRHFFRPDGSMPETVTLELVIPPELGPREDVVRELAARVAAVEEETAAERRRTGTRILGRRGVLRQAWNGAPTSFVPRRNLRPRVAAHNMWARIEALHRNREFIRAYRDARARWIAGDAVSFPAGTYWLRRFAHVPLVASLPS